MIFSINRDVLLNNLTIIHTGPCLVLGNERDLKSEEIEINIANTGNMIAYCISLIVNQ